MGVRNLFDLSGRVALVTGGSRGLGLQAAEALGEQGARLVITARKQPDLDEAASRLAGQGHEVLTVAADLGRLDTVPGLVDRVLERYGTIDILVNNAGATWGEPLETFPAAAWTGCSTST